MVAVSLKKFFFQAEDGIRDHCVTGVQTCALPISFSLDRMQNVLTLLYQIDKKHPIYKRILVDSPLGVAISREWWNAIDVNVPLWTDVFMWDKVTWLRDFSDTLYFRTINRDCLILAGGGFLQGRSEERRVGKECRSRWS